MSTSTAALSITQSNAIAEMFRSEHSGHSVSAVYSGSFGCACGCKGTHSSSERSIKIVVGKIRRAIESGEYVNLEYAPNSYVSIETETRVYIAYVDGRRA